MKFNRSVYQNFSLIGQFGINMLVPIFLCSFLGAFLDKKLGTNFLVIILFFVGAVAGGYNVYRLSKRQLRKSNPDSAYLHDTSYNCSTNQDIPDEDDNTD